MYWQKIRDRIDIQFIKNEFFNVVRLNQFHYEIGSDGFFDGGQKWKKKKK